LALVGECRPILGFSVNTPAFREQFGIAPESVRAQRHLGQAIKMDDGPITTVARPRFEEGRLLLIAGLAERIPRTATRLLARSPHLQPKTAC
jgi:hypothetical protein